MRGAWMWMWAIAAPAVAAVPEKASPVTKATLHPDGAIVARVLDEPCRASPVAVRFAGLPPGIEQGTLRATASGGAAVEGVSVVEKIHREAFGEEVRRLELEIAGLEAEVLAQQRLAESARAARERAASLRAASMAFIEREAAVAPKPDVARWTAALDSTRAEIAAQDAAIRAAETSQRELARKIEELTARRDELEGAAPRRSLEAEVVVTCKARTMVELSYATTAARWAPVYEARADRAAGKLALSVLAEVRQATGEDWKDVEVTLSTALSRRDARPPEPQRLYVGANEREETKKVLVKREEAASQLRDLGGAVGSTGEAVVADEGLSVRLTVPGKADVAGDGRPARLLVESLPLPATFSLVAMPKLLPRVVMSGEARNTAKYPLLPGRIDLFDQSGYLGTTRLARTAEGDRVKLAFGLEENVQLRRVVLTEESKAPGLLGSTRRLFYGYRIELESSAGKALEVQVTEQIPVSELDDVKVVLDAKKTTPGFEHVVADGHLKWKVALGAGEKKAIELHFTVEIPEKYESAGL